VIVFFDIGATLITGPPHGPASRLAHRLRLPDPIKGVLHRHLLTQRITSPQVLVAYLVSRCGVARVDAASAVADLWHSQEAEAEALPGAVEAYRTIRAAGVRAGLISNIWRPYERGARRVLPSIFSGPLEAHPRVFSYEIGIMKPDVRIYQYALATAGVSARDAVMIGDSYQNDIAPALSIGMRTVWLIHRPSEESAEIRSVLAGRLPVPDHLCQSINEVRPAPITELIQVPRSSARSGSARLEQLRTLEAGFTKESA
jgi:HAD superfamily hydrolase (TIGR01549 family)